MFTKYLVTACCLDPSKPNYSHEIGVWQCMSWVSWLSSPLISASPAGDLLWLAGQLQHMCWSTWLEKAWDHNTFDTELNIGTFDFGMDVMMPGLALRWDRVDNFGRGVSWFIVLVWHAGTCIIVVCPHALRQVGLVNAQTCIK